MKHSYCVNLIMALLLSGCGATGSDYRPVVDGAPGVGYERDLAACQQLSTERSYVNDEVRSAAAVGSGIGATVGALEDGVGGAVAGAVVGAVVGGAGRSWQTLDERRAIVIECMKQRGHAAVG